MQFYVLRLIPPRPTFVDDMTEDERAVMLKHVAYWAALAEKGTAVLFGPVADPKGGYGLGIVEVEDAAAIDALEANDPTILSGLGFKYESAPMMRAILRKSLQPAG